MKIIQIDLNAEEMGTNLRSEAALLGDCGLIVTQLTNVTKKSGWTFNNEEWWKVLNAKVQ